MPEESETATQQMHSLDSWSESAATLFYCEYCQQVFLSFDVFYDHRMASDVESVRSGEEFDGYRELAAGEDIPDDATVGELSQCEPVAELGETTNQETDVTENNE